MRLETSARVFPEQSLDDKIARLARIVDAYPCDEYAYKISATGAKLFAVEVECLDPPSEKYTRRIGNDTQILKDMDFRAFKEAYCADLNRLVGKPVFGVYENITPDAKESTELLRGLIPLLI